jgi:hypothetical protein
MTLPGHGTRYRKLPPSPPVREKIGTVLISLVNGIASFC